MPISFTWIGHATFTFDIDGHTVVVDPFINDNPIASVKADDINPEIILLTHAHGDHSADVESIAKRTGAKLVTNFECGNYYMGRGLQNVIQGNPGGTYDAGFMEVKWTIAHHSSSFPDGTYGGEPNGFLISTPRLRMYFAGDTALFMDMQHLGNMDIDVAFLPIGDLFTMGVDDSVQAVQWLDPQYVVPMHYNTFPPIMQDVSAWAERINTETDASPIVLDPNDTYTLE